MDTIKILAVIAWRNLWRSKVRSAVVIVAMAMGIWASIFLSGFSIGLNEQRTQSALETYVGFAQVHSKGWKEESSVDLFIPNVAEVENAVRNSEFFEASSARLVLTGMANSSRGSMGIQIQGVDPAADTLVNNLNDLLVEGEYLPEGGRAAYAYIGTALAEELKLQIGDRLPLTFQALDGYPAPYTFFVGGTFKTVSSTFDKMTVIVRKSDLAGYLGIDESKAHEVIIKLSDRNQARAYASNLQAQIPNVEVEAWQEISPELGYADDMMAYSLNIFISIIIFAITFGILNTMLMAILERRRELGMLQAIGMNKSRTFSLIVLETFLLGTIGAPLGIFLGHISLITSGTSGFDLSAFGDGLSSYGMDTMVYPVPVPSYYVSISFMVVTLTLLASLYPAYKALKLNPVQAIRSV